MLRILSYLAGRCSLSVAAAISILIAGCGLSSSDTSTLLLAECDVAFLAYAPSTGDPIIEKEVQLSYYRGGDELLGDSSLRLPRPEGDGRTYITDQEGEFEAVVYKHSDSALIIETGDITYQMLTSDLKLDITIEETEEDRITGERSENPVNFNLRVLECRNI